MLYQPLILDEIYRIKGVGARIFSGLIVLFFVISLCFFVPENILIYGNLFYTNAISFIIGLCLAILIFRRGERADLTTINRQYRKIDRLYGKNFILVILATCLLLTVFYWLTLNI